MLPNPIFSFNIGSYPVEIHMYGVMIAVGIALALAVLFIYSKPLKIDPKFTDFVYYTLIISIALGFGSAALFQATYNFIENPENGFKVGGGITFIGGLIGGVAAFMAIYGIARKKLTDRLTNYTLSILACCIPLGHAFGRIGCFFAGCCHGKPTDSICGVAFPAFTGNVKVHPTQLYEAAFLFLLFAACSFLVLKLRSKHAMSLYLVAYGIFRFLIEYVRDDDRGQLVAGISPSQFWSLLMIAAGVGLVFLINWLDKREECKIEIVEIAENALPDEPESHEE